MADETPETNSIALAASLTAAWLGNPNVRTSADEVPAFLREMHATLSQLVQPPEQSAAVDGAHTPAVSPRASIRPDYLVSLIDGKRYKTLRRHLAGHGLTPEQYRERYGLRADYPMVAPNYSAARREMAQKIGLGRKPTVGGAGAEGTTTPDGFGDDMAAEGESTTPAPAAAVEAPTPAPVDPAAAETAAGAADQPRPRRKLSARFGS